MRHTYNSGAAPSGAFSSGDPKPVKMNTLRRCNGVGEYALHDRAFGYALEPLREGPDFAVYRGRLRGDPTPVLAVAPAAERPSPRSPRRLEHEYLLAAELDAAWAAKPLALTRHEGQTVLILKDPGGEPLDLVLERDFLGN